MTNIISISSTELGQRRQQLRRQRRLRLLQVIWQTLAVSGLTGGLFWLIYQPVWLIRQPQQVKVQGNYILSNAGIKSLLPLSYPQPLWQVQPKTLEETLELESAIAEARVTRQLFPPSLTVEITERRPVAIAQPSATLTQPVQVQQVGWLDADGGWMPLESYTELERTRQLPSLKIIGNLEQYRPNWPPVYEAISRSPVVIEEINWQDPANIILKTEMGSIHLGPYTPRFPEQLRAIDRMRQLPEQLDVATIDYIDLKNPASPMIQVFSNR
ncbi:MAG: FtsQ-type POTRA domain-containing protein [Microcoleaceae cyanobacterium]